MAPIPPVLVLVGGFLGAGKTTLLLKAAARLRDRGARVALLFNDQGEPLVDTRLGIASGLEAEQVAGGCFCCRLSDFVGAAERLLAHAPEVILAEPVGSCIDISATVIQPLKRFYGDRFRLAPFTALVDPRMARELLSPGADPHLAYLFTNQLAEADLVCFSKADLFTDFPELPTGFAMRLSAHTGEGVSEWLYEVLEGGSLSGGRLLRVDYARYSEAEAALGWLNWHADLLLRRALSPARVVGPLLDELDQALTQAAVQIVHLKAFDQARTGYIKASLCGNQQQPFVEGMLDALPARRHELLLNLRARAAPELLEATFSRVAARLPGKTSVRHFECFRPPPPKPEKRIESL